MRRTVVAALVAVTVAVSGSLVAATADIASAAPSASGLEHRDVPLCPAAPAGYAHCHAILHQVITPDGAPGPNATSPTGLSPAQYLQAYGWADGSGTRLIGTGANETVAVVDAYDDPTIVSDLGTFSTTFGIPCNTCLTKVNQAGGTTYPSASAAWSLEISLDVEWAHAIAPAAHVLLVEASTSSLANLMAAEDYASAHAQYVSNSWGSSEFSGESSYDTHFQAPGVSYFASSGDTGGQVEYPSSSPDVVSVGGTTLTGSGTSWTESGWSSSGGGCSTQELANAAQHTTPYVACNGTKATPDVASDADPNTGVAVYDTTRYSGQTGWFEVGGTSAASPVWAARAADRGVQVNAAYVYGQYPTGYPTLNIDYRDITTGNNGYPAEPGYDLVTGLGSWTGGDGSTGTTGAPAAAAITGTSCSGATCAFTGSGAAPLGWTFGDGGTATGSSVSHTYTAAGTWTVTLTAADGSQAHTSISCSTKSSRHRTSLVCS